MKKPFYITTPIYYITDAPHIGHLYTTLAADIIARYHRLLGDDVWFLTGTDEHGQKIQKKAKETNEMPKALADRVVTRYLDAWKVYGIHYNDFIRTTEDRHKKVVTEYVARLMKTGDIYLGSYEGWYCVPDETYWTESQLIDNNCPDCGRPVEKLQEESYFFKMSAFQDRLLKHIDQNPDFIIPESRRNEVVSFIKQGLKDISVSRTTIEWGIPMPADNKVTKQHKVYVWFDALTNYISALGPLDNDLKFKKYWGSAIHLVGKDILRFHAVYWPTFLMALGIELPKQIVAHGWLTDSNRKISKSLGNVIDPIGLSQKVGVDGMRFFLFREFSFGLDGEYTEEIMYRRINSDLANDYGNALSRVCNMLEKAFPSIESGESLKKPSDVRSAAEAVLEPYQKAMDGFHYEKALEQVWTIIGGINRYVDAMAPWTLAKSTDPNDKKKLADILVHCHEGLRIASIFLLPFIPSSAEKALSVLGDPESGKITSDLTRTTKWGAGPKTIKVKKGQPLFPRLEYQKP